MSELQEYLFANDVEGGTVVRNLYDIQCDYCGACAEF